MVFLANRGTISRKQEAAKGLKPYLNPSSLLCLHRTTSKRCRGIGASSNVPGALIELAPFKPSLQRNRLTSMPSSSLLRRRSGTQTATVVQRLSEDQKRRALGLPTTLSCSASEDELPNANNSSGFNVTVEFEYELAVANPNEPVVEVTSQDIPFLEYAVLQLVAQAIHLRPCDLPAQMLDLNSNATVTGLSSFHPDSVDDSVRKCYFRCCFAVVLNTVFRHLTNSCNLQWSRAILRLRFTKSLYAAAREAMITCYEFHCVSHTILLYLVHAFPLFTTASCEYLADLDPSWICLPMKGGMTATYFGTSEDREVVVGYLLSNIQNVVNNAGKTIGRVDDAYFVESRVRPASASKTVSSSESESDSFVAVASSLAGAAVVTMLVFFFVAARRRRKAKNDPPTPAMTIGAKEIVFQDRNPALLSLPTAVTTSTTTPSINTISKSEELLRENGDMEVSSNGDSAQGTIDSPSLTDAVAAPITLMTGRTASTANMDDSDSDNENTPSDQYEEELQRISNIPPNDDKFKNVGTSGTGEAGPTVMVDISKPPKPPTVPSNKPHVPVPVSKPLKKRRKRKKKKKSSSATRTRDIVAGMETIAECIEEEKSGNGDDDSEYSWYSTSDSEPGSRDPSPARSREESPSRSLSSSHEESPPRPVFAEKNDVAEKPQDPQRWV